jgi:hypothetical protein
MKKGRQFTPQEWYDFKYTAKQVVCFAGIACAVIVVIVYLIGK